MCTVPLVNYSSSESDSSNEDSPAKNVSMKTPKLSKLTDEIAQLPLPKSIEEMFSDEPDTAGHDGLCQGRTRSFPHVRGNWATFVFLKYEPPDDFDFCCKKFHKQLPVVLSRCEPSIKWPEFHSFPCTELHISLSRTVPIQYHLIEPLVTELRTKLTQKSSFTVSLKDISYYSNEEELRSFIGLDVQEGKKEISLLVDCVDESFKKFGLPIFYQERSFHISLVWCLGNLLFRLTSSVKQSIQDLWLKCQQESDLQPSCQVSFVHLKTGNKNFTFDLHGNND